MHKIVAGTFDSLDGVMESPDQWHFPYFDDAMGEAVGEQMPAATIEIIDFRGALSPAAGRVGRAVPE